MAIPRPFAPHCRSRAPTHYGYSCGRVSCLAQLASRLVEAAPQRRRVVTHRVDPPSSYRAPARHRQRRAVSRQRPTKVFANPNVRRFCLQADSQPASFAIITGIECHGRGWSHLEFASEPNQALTRFTARPIFEFLKQHPAERKFQ